MGSTRAALAPSHIVTDRPSDSWVGLGELISFQRQSALSPRFHRLARGRRSDHHEEIHRTLVVEQRAAGWFALGSCPGLQVGGHRPAAGAPLTT